jgi:hypothetical protein
LDAQVAQIALVSSRKLGENRGQDGTFTTDRSSGSLIVVGEQFRRSAALLRRQAALQRCLQFFDELGGSRNPSPQVNGELRLPLTFTYHWKSPFLPDDLRASLAAAAEQVTQRPPPEKTTFHYKHCEYLLHP